MPPNQHRQQEQQSEQSPFSTLQQTSAHNSNKQHQEPSLSDRSSSTSSSGGASDRSQPLDTIDSGHNIMPPPPPLQETLSSEISDDFDSGDAASTPVMPPPGSRRPKRRSHSDIPQSVDAMGSYIAGYPLQQSLSSTASANLRGSTGSNGSTVMSPPTFTASYGAIAGSTPPRPHSRKRSGSLEQQQHHRRSGSTSSNFSPRNEARKFLPSAAPSPRGQQRNHHRRKNSWSSANNNGSGGRSVNGDDSQSVGSAGEAAFGIATSSNPSNHSHRRSLSDRSSSRAHRRQQSVQLVMDTVKGVEQPMVCRNVAFLLLFVFHLLLVSAAGKLYVPPGLFTITAEDDGTTAVIPGATTLDTDTDADTTNVDTTSIIDTPITLLYRNFVILAAVAGFCGILLSHIFLGILAIRARNFIPVALLLTIAGSFLWGTAGIGVSPHTAVPVTGFLAFALAMGYAFIVWDRIPFASANLVTAVAGIPLGLVGWAVLWQGLAWCATVYYTVVVCGVVNQKWDPEVEPWVYGALVCSMVWTFQVIQGIVQATTAGVIGGWWHDPKNTSIVRDSFFKTVFYSLGSICFGAIVVAPVRLLRLISVLFRPSSDESSSLLVLHEIVHCIQSCLFSCVDAIAARVNPWAYTYIGMFHYNFLDAGYGATELFAMRGWSTIVSDDLVPNVFFLTSLMISGATGCCCYIMSQWESLRVVPGDTDDEPPGLVTFVEGAVIGWVMSSIVFSVASSAVNAVLVCFASSPVDLEENHPELSKQMRSAWREVWPNALDSCDYEAMQSRAMNIGAIPSYPGINNGHNGGTVYPFPVYPAEEHPLL